MRFSLQQSYAADPDVVAAAYADPSLYATFADLPRAGRPEVLHHEIDDDTVHIDIRWSFTANLSSAARAVIDPARLSWVERSAHRLADRVVTFRMLPDHYADRFRCDGSSTFVAEGSGTVRRSQGELRVKAPLVARAVEGAIVDGLSEQLQAEVALVERFIKG